MEPETSAPGHGAVSGKKRSRPAHLRGRTPSSRSRGGAAAAAEWGGERPERPQFAFGNFDPHRGHTAVDDFAFTDHRLDVLSSVSLSGARVLDIGCGAGYTCIALAERYPQIASIVGVDADKKLVKRARELLRDRVARAAARRAADESSSSSSSAAGGAGTAATLTGGAAVDDEPLAPLPPLPASVRVCQQRQLLQLERLQAVLAAARAAAGSATAPPVVSPAATAAAGIGVSAASGGAAPPPPPLATPVVVPALAAAARAASDQRVQFRREDFVGGSHALGHAPDGYDLVIW